jgi:hypothetical protein
MPKAHNQRQAFLCSVKAVDGQLNVMKRMTYDGSVSFCLHKQRAAQMLDDLSDRPAFVPLEVLREGWSQKKFLAERMDSFVPLSGECDVESYSIIADTGEKNCGIIADTGKRKCQHLCWSAQSLRVPFREGWVDLQDARINSEVVNPRLCMTLIINPEIDGRNTAMVVWNENEYMSMQNLI